MEVKVSENALTELNKIIEEKSANNNVRVYIAGIG